MTAANAVVVPCFNEAARLDAGAFVRLADLGSMVVLVDDGSTDQTRSQLERIVATEPSRFRVVGLDENCGKGEAVRVGLLAAISEGAGIVGYLDADLATPVDEYDRLLRILTDRVELDAVIGSRVALAGHRIARSQRRHYLGRLYATAASIVLGLAIYDTQCGAKVFRVDERLRAALDRPFVDRWSFDVELLGRLLQSGDLALLEVPLGDWAEVPGSKLRLSASCRALWSLAQVARRLRDDGADLTIKPDGQER